MTTDARVKEILDYFNEQSGQKRTYIDQYDKMIKARLKEHDIEDIKLVIRYLAADIAEQKKKLKKPLTEWQAENASRKLEKSELYFRPSTVFRPINMANYIDRAKAWQDESYRKAATETQKIIMQAPDIEQPDTELTEEERRNVEEGLKKLGIKNSSILRGIQENK